MSSRVQELKGSRVQELKGSRVEWFRGEMGLISVFGLLRPGGPRNWKLETGN